MRRNQALVLALVLALLPVLAHGADFVHPLDFEGTKKEKERVIEYIERNVKKTYAQIGMDSATNLRMMEKNELRAFKELTEAKDREALDRMIDTYCGIGMCSYSNILMMYKQEVRSSKESLEW